MPKQKQSSGFKFKPFSRKQKQLLYWWREGSPYYDCDVMIADGSIRSGKSIACICSFLQWSQESFSDENFIIAGKTINTLKKNIIMPMLRILMAWKWEFTYNRSENYIRIGYNTYYLYDANNEASQDKLQGLTAAGAFADEVALFPQNFIDQMIGRCSVEGSRIFMNCNPESPSHYVYTEFIMQAAEKRICHLHFTMDDNLSLSEKIKERYKRMYTGLFYKRFILGLWCVAEGLVYPMFSKNKHVREPDKKLDGFWYISCDYGTVNPMSIGLWCMTGGRAYRIKEYYHDSRKQHKQLTDEEYYKELEKLAGERYIQSVVVDPSAASFIECIKKHGRFSVKKAKNDVMDGIRVTSSMLAAEKLIFAPCCEDAIREFGMYSWDDRPGEEKVVKEFDHAMDDIRYFCNTILRKEWKFDSWAVEDE